MAEETVGDVINTNDSIISLPGNFNKFRKIIIDRKFENFRWEKLYQKYMTNVIKILDVHNDTFRLFLIRELVITNNNFIETLDRLRTRKMVQFSMALKLTNDHLKDILPDADPVYLDILGEYFAFNDFGLDKLIEDITTNKRKYPKKHEYEERLKVVKTIRSLTVEFNIEDFLRMCPDPVNYFKTVKINLTHTYLDASMTYLGEKFNSFEIVTIRSTLINNEFSCTKTVEVLEKNLSPRCKRTKRKTVDINHINTDSIEFFKEMAFIERRNEIINYIESKKAAHKKKFEEAKSTGNLVTCECCYNDEFLSSEIFSCPAGHGFCSSCINKGTEVAAGENKAELKCFAHCDREFDVSMIKQIVDDKLYQRIMRLKQAQEIKEAKIEGLETCAFCDYSVILPPEYKIIQCLNPGCKKETCRECREEGHVPYRCDQLEKAPEVQVRTMIENIMTEVLIRSCNNCNRKFVKENGCNRMVCICGKIMCYICKLPFQDNEQSYEHFYHFNILPDKCPLHTDTNFVHNKAVEIAAMLTFQKLQKEKPTLLGKIDIDKLLPTMKITNNGQVIHNSPINESELLAKMTGQNVEDINDLINNSKSRRDP